MATFFTRTVTRLPTYHFRRLLHTNANNSPLLTHLLRHINFHGPLTVPNFLHTCLLHPTLGYYTSRPSITPDFITSPTFSSVFPELLSVFIAHSFPHTPFHLVELGPGTGDLLHVLVPLLQRFNVPLRSVILVEPSTLLRDQQRELLSSLDIKVEWRDNLTEALPDGHPALVLMHEYLDALPVAVFHRTHSEKWREKMVDRCDQKSERLRFVLAKESTPSLELLKGFPPPDDSDVHEVCLEAARVVEAVSKHISNWGGMALMVDYGKLESGGDTLRGYSNHQQVDVLETPGQCDITADVRFGQLGRVVERMKGVEMRPVISQKEFLGKLGIAQRMRRMALSVIDAGGDQVDDKLDRLQAEYDMLMGSMGERFKVAVVVREGEGTHLAGGLGD